MKAFRFSYAILLLFYATAPAFAQPGLKLKSVHFKGNEVLSDGELLTQMNTKPKKSFQKLFFWKKNPDFIEAVFQDDMDRLRSYYIRNGFINAGITYKTDISDKAVRAIVTITENDFVKLREVILVLSGDSLSTHVIDSLKRKIPLKQGERFRDKDVFDSETLIGKAYNNDGYPFIKVEHKINLDKDELLCDVKFNVITGEKSFFDGVTIEGDSLIPERFIRKYIRFSPGQLYSAKKINKTQQDIFGTGLFSYVVTNPVKDSVQVNRIPVRIMLKELPGWQLEAGAGYGTEDRFRLAVQLTRLNFLGGARKMIINAKTSYFVPYSLDARFVQPDIFFPKLDFVFNPFILKEREISYRIDRLGGGINFLYRLSKVFNGQVTYAFEHDKLLQLGGIIPDSVGLRHNKSVFGIGGKLDFSNDPFYPSRGYKLNINVSYAIPGFGSDLHYYKTELSLVNYIPLGNEVLATKISTGVIQSLGRSPATPVEERFYLGGASSLRGWGRHRISPVDASGFAPGGNTMIEAGGELRFPVYDILHGVIFLDAGNAWAKAFSYDPANLHYDAGVGLRVRTPIGPIRLDFASPVINDHFSFQFFISVGNAF